MAEFKDICPLAALPEGEGKTFLVGGKAVAVFRRGEAVYALEDFCPHMGAPIAGGALDEGHVTCPWHAWRFRLDDGGWTVNPKVRIPCYEVRVADGRVSVATTPTPPPPPEAT